MFFLTISCTRQTQVYPKTCSQAEAPDIPPETSMGNQSVPYGTMKKNKSFTESEWFGDLLSQPQVVFNLFLKPKWFYAAKLWRFKTQVVLS